MDTKGETGNDSDYCKKCRKYLGKLESCAHWGPAIGEHTLAGGAGTNPTAVAGRLKLERDEEIYGRKMTLIGGTKLYIEQTADAEIIRKECDVCRQVKELLPICGCEHFDHPARPPVPREDLDRAYGERNKAVALAVRLARALGYNAGVGCDTSDHDWPVVFLDLPGGQVSWHVSAKERGELFGDMGVYTGPSWDGHTTEEKWRRCLAPWPSARLGVRGSSAEDVPVQTGGIYQIAASELKKFAEELLRGPRPGDAVLGGVPCHTKDVLREVYAERERQDDKWGEQNHPSLPPDVQGSIKGTVVAGILRQIPPHWACRMLSIPTADQAKGTCDAAAKAGKVSFADIALEEFAESIEALAENERDGRAELVQLAAVCVGWIEAIDRRRKREQGE